MAFVFFLVFVSSIFALVVIAVIVSKSKRLTRQAMVGWWFDYYLVQKKHFDSINVCSFTFLQ